MAHVLTHAPIGTSTDMYNLGGSSVGSIPSTGTVQHHKIRSISTSSLSSAGSYFSISLRRQDDSAPPGSVSTFNLRNGNYIEEGALSTSRRTSIASVPNSKRQRGLIATEKQRDLRLVDVAENEDKRRHHGEQSAYEHAESTTSYASAVAGCEVAPNHNAAVDAAESPEALDVPFRRWMSALKRRKKPSLVTPRTERWQLDDFDGKLKSPTKTGRSRHEKSGSYASSSMSFVRTVKSATATFASASVGTISRGSSRFRRGQHSSIVSRAYPRPSMDTQRSLVDEIAKHRSRKRREKIEELIRTEEGYVADLKALSNAYSTILGQHSGVASFTRASAQKTIGQLLHLHDEILGQLHRVVPFAEYDMSKAKEEKRPMRHARWYSVDVVPTRTPPQRSKITLIRQTRRSLNISRSTEDEPAVLRCSPQIAASVARVFSSVLLKEVCKQVSRFLAYEDFGANFYLLHLDIEDTQRTIAAWVDYDRAIEALSLHINPVHSREANRKRAMTVKDLLIKPIQRLPRYELLFADLCKLTPVCDDPDSHAAVEEALELLSLACQRMNAAKDHPAKTRTLETTWLIGDRLSFAGQLPRSVFLQLLGPVVLCGCLHIAYRGRDRIKGYYLICILFESTLLFAAADEDQSTYRTLAGVALAHATIEESDNGKGLQCHTAPHSWKLVFEHSARMYEVILTACSATEATIWREHISKHITTQTQAVADGTANTFDLQSPLAAEMRSIGKAFGKPGSFVRRMSVHRTATVGPTSDLNQVVIKNTQAEKEVLNKNSSATLQIPRSQSVATPSHVQTLAPRRADRARLEATLSDVWTKALLPYPGMTRRSDPIRASANHVIRKFSMASITSNFSSKRNASWTSVTQTLRKEDMPPPPPKLTKAPKVSRLPAQKIDFHTAPQAFLPADFDLDNLAETKRKQSALGTFTMTGERTSKAMMGTEGRGLGLRRAQSVCNPDKEGKTSKTAATAPGELQPPVYSVVRQHRAQTPAMLPTSEDLPVKTPRKSKSKNVLQRLFG